jgi:hypothetical protein
VYQFFSDVVVAAHFLFIVFVVGGGLLVIRWPRLAFLHLPAVIWGAVIELTGWICPLTPLENYLRRLGGDSVYSGGFLEQYILPLIYPANLTSFAQYILGSLVIAINLILYTLVLRKQHFLRR